MSGSFSGISRTNRDRTNVARRAARSRRPAVEPMEGRRLLTGLVTVSSAYATEYGTADTTMTFSVKLVSPTTVPVTVNYQTSDGTAKAGLDYVATSGTVTIPAGQTSAPVPVTILPDTAAKQNLSFGFKISNATNGLILSGSTSGVITELNSAVPPTVSIANASVTRGAQGPYTLTFNVSLNYAFTAPITLTIATADVTAKAGVDYQAETETLTFAPGQTTAQFTVTVLGTTLPGTKLLEVTLSGASTPSGATVPIGTPMTAGYLYFSA